MKEVETGLGREQRTQEAREEGVGVQMLLEGKRSELVEGLGELLHSMAGKNKDDIKRERERVQYSLSDLREAVGAQGGQGEPFWQAAQGLVSALAEGNEERAAYYGEQLEAALGATMPNEEAAETL